MSVIEAFLGKEPATRVLDFGCGKGTFVARLCELGYDAYGCDLGEDWPKRGGAWNPQHPEALWASNERLRAIEASPYRLPFPDGYFDAVVSTSVLEHAQNKAEIFAEIDRVLRPGGRAIHLFPSRYRLPVEPHIMVPLVSWLWPSVPDWWLWVWAALGVRNQFQKDLPSKRVVELNASYCQKGLSYFSRSQYEDIMPARIAWESEFYVRNATGNAARLARALKIPPTLLCVLREELMVVRPL